MRPGLTLRPLDTHPEDLPPGEWYLTYKLDDERAVMLPDGSLWNRQGAPLAKEKAVRFSRHVQVARGLVPGEVLDLALVGIRRPEQGDFMVILDLPDSGASDYVCRLQYRCRCVVPEWSGPWSDGPSCLVSRLSVFSGFGLDGVQEIMERTRRNPYIEGLIGRRANTPYRHGTSNDMFRSKK